MFVIYSHHANNLDHFVSRVLSVEGQPFVQTTVIPDRAMKFPARILAEAFVVKWRGAGVGLRSDCEIRSVSKPRKGETKR
jgi:hypothetical protein